MLPRNITIKRTGILIIAVIIFLASSADIYATSLDVNIRSALKAHKTTNTESWKWKVKDTNNFYQDVRNAYPSYYIACIGKYQDLHGSKWRRSNDRYLITKLNQRNIRYQRKVTVETEQKLRSVIYSKGSTAKKVRKLNNYIIKHIRPARAGERRNKYVSTAYSAVTGVGICQGYAAAFKYLCDINNIECRYIIGHKKARPNIMCGT